MKNKTMQELNEQYKDCPVQVNTYEMDGRTYIVHSHFIGVGKGLWHWRRRWAVIMM